MLSQLIPLAVVNLLRARVRLAMTTGGVLIGTSAVILLIAFTLGLQNAAEAGIGSNSILTEIHVTGRAASASQGSNDPTIPNLNLDAVQKLKHIRGVKAAIPLINLQGSQIIAGKVMDSRQIIGVDPDLIPYLEVTAETGDIKLLPGQAVSGHDAGKNFSNSRTNSKTFTPVDVDLMTTKLRLQVTHFDGGALTTRELGLKVIGVLKAGTPYDQMIMMPINDVITLNEWITGIKYDPKTFRYDQVTVRVQDRTQTNDVAQAMQKMGFATDSIGDLLNQLNSFFTTMQLILGGVGLIALLVAASGVANTMMMATRERTREIGVMKAIGATDQDILTIFLLEAALIGLLGGVGGVGLSLLLQNVINEGIKNLSLGGGGSGATLTVINLSNMSNPVIIPANLALLAIGLATFVCVAAGLYPAFYAARLSPVIALKQE